MSAMGGKRTSGCGLGLSIGERVMPEYKPSIADSQKREQQASANANDGNLISRRSLAQRECGSGEEHEITNSKRPRVNAADPVPPAHPIENRKAEQAASGKLDDHW